MLFVHEVYHVECDYDVYCLLQSEFLKFALLRFSIVINLAQHDGSWDLFPVKQIINISEICLGQCIQTTEQ